MTQIELNRFKAILTARAAELARLIRRRDGIVIERSADQLEGIRWTAVHNLDREFNQLRNARAALRRIQEGSFGTCQECDDDIPAKRLAAVPWAPFRIVCQEAVDRSPQEMQTVTRGFLASAV